MLHGKADGEVKYWYFV